MSGTQGLAVTYCCHGDEENQMMAISQKCSLTLLPLPGKSTTLFFIIIIFIIRYRYRAAVH